MAFSALAWAFIGMIIMFFYMIVVLISAKVQSGDIQQPSLYRVFYHDYNDIHRGIHESKEASMSTFTKRAIYDANAEEFEIIMKTGFDPRKRVSKKIRRDNCWIFPLRGGLLIIDGMKQLDSKSQMIIAKLHESDIKKTNKIAELERELARGGRSKEKIEKNVLQLVSNFNQEYFKGVDAKKRYGTTTKR